MWNASLFLKGFVQIMTANPNMLHFSVSHIVTVIRCIGHLCDHMLIHQAELQVFLKTEAETEQLNAEAIFLYTPRTCLKVAKYYILST